MPYEWQRRKDTTTGHTFYARADTPLAPGVTATEKESLVTPGRNKPNTKKGRKVTTHEASVTEPRQEANNNGSE